MPRRVNSIVLVLLVACAHVAADPTRPPQRQFDLRLHDALFRGEQPGARPASLILLLKRTEHGWNRAWGTARDFNHGIHTARVDEAELTDDAFELELAVKLLRDARSDLEGQASFRITLRRDGGNEDAAPVYAGRYEGEFNGTAIRGAARARELPPYPERPASFEPIARDEHPRILFRAGELPALREKARTPLGRAALERMEGPVGLAVRYALTGDREHAGALPPLLEKLMARGLVSDQYGNNVGARLEKTAIAYDICRDVWPEEFTRRVEFYMLWAGEGILNARRDTHQGVNWNIASNWASPLYTGAAFAGLALWGQKGPRPRPPALPATGAEIAPARNYKPGPGVPVSSLESDVMPSEWIYAGGFKTDLVDGDPLAELGSTASARPQPGAEVGFGDRSYTFKPLSHEKDEGTWSHANYDDGKLLIDITNAVDREYFSTSFFYTVLHNERPRWVRFETSLHHSAILHLNGHRLRVGDVAHIEAGLYPFLVEAYIDQINPWGRQLMRPRLVEISGDEARRTVQRQRAEHERELARWRVRVQEWEELGKMDLRHRDLFERGRHMMYLFCREAVGDGGAQAELAHYSTIAEKPPSRYMSAHRRAFGYPVSPQADIELLLPRKMFVHVYPPNGEPRAQEINGTPSIAGELFASLLPVTPRRWQPAMLWGWRRHAGGASDDEAEWSRLVEDNPTLSLLHYPLDMKPVHPRELLPLSWRAEDFGLYAFRNAWKGRNDFVAQVWLKAQPVGGWNAPNAGTFRLLGLGHIWADGPTDRNRHRWEESVVQLPDDGEIAEGACARLTHMHTFPDGSGVVSMDLADVYARRNVGEDGRKMRLYERYGGIRNPVAFGDSGIRGMRSIAFDYSGLSGAPCLVAVVDRIQGGGRKVWTWQLDDGGKAGSSDVPRTSVEGNMVTVEMPDGATLRGIFVTGQDPVARVRMTSMTGRAGSQAGKKLDRPIHGIFAEDRGNGDGSFFFVATIQRGPAPEVSLRGNGLDATVTIGERTVRFDGEKIVLGSAP